MKIPNPHAVPSDGLITALGTDSKRGLSDAVARERLAEYGPNALPRQKRRPVILLLFKQFHSSLMYILAAAGIVSVAVGEEYDAYGIGIAMLMNVLVGFFLERRAENAIESLRDMIVPETMVLRDGRIHRIVSELVVPGDILQLEEGSRVPADARLLESHDLETDESALTGESSSVRKEPGVAPADAPVPERTGMIWMGTGIVRGSGYAVAVETGQRTEFGRIAGSLRDIKRGRTPLEMRLDRLGRQLGLAAIALAAVTLTAGLVRGFPPQEMLFFAIAMMVSIVPEGLPEVLAVVLAVGVIRMAKRNAVIRHLPSVETLGAADVICTDKTGTLTENKMTVREIILADMDVAVSGEGWEPRGEFTADGVPLRPREVPGLERLLLAGALTSKAALEMKDERYHAVGDATDAAMTVAAAKAGIDGPKAEGGHVILDEVPFSSARKYHAVLAESDDPNGGKVKTLFVSGAYGVLREKSASVFGGDKEAPFDEAARRRFDGSSESSGSRSLRVIAVASKKMPAGATSVSDADISGLTLLGLAAMIDPPRAGAAAAVERCRRAGIRVIMLTGDQRATAVAIGKEIGLLREGEDFVLTEKEAAAMNDGDFQEALRRVRIFARVSPETKLRVVTGLQRLGQTVAMTGDGVNDAPALKKASIGIAMGIAGTDAAKEVADMVLSDDNFVSIVNAVEEGRIVFRNVKQTVSYLFMTNLGEAVTMLGAILLGMPLPLLAVQILWMNLVTDGFPDVALAAEPAGPHMLDAPPRAKDEPILSRETMKVSILTASMMCIGTLSLFSWALGRGDLAYARTVAFTAMSAFQLWNVFNMRSAEESMFTIGFWSNRYVTAAVIFSSALQLLVIYLPSLQAVFQTVPLGLTELLLITAVSSSVFVAVEIWKAAIRHRRRPVPAAA